MGEIFFIVGRGRSGTTLLSRMLLKHPEIVVAPEGFFAMSLERRYGDGAWNTDRVAAFCEDLLLEDRMRTWDLDVPRLRRVLLQRVDALSYPEVCRAVYGVYAEGLGRADAKWLGDKNPHYALLTRRIAERFPRACFVHIVRDPRDNICSYRGVSFDVGNVAALAYRWRRYNEEILRASRACPARFLRLRYEDLLDDPVRELTRVSEFLGVGFDAGMLAFHDPDPRTLYGRRSCYRTELRKPLDAGRAERWRAELSERSVREVETICGVLGHTLGYQPADDRRAALSVSGQLGRLSGWGSVLAEKVVFDALSPAWRSQLINVYRRSSGSV